MKIKTKLQSGFTLLEVLVVISIMGIFVAMSLPSYRGYTRTLAVKESAKDVRSLLWEAQALSLGPKDDAAKSYSVTVDKSATGGATFFLEQDPENLDLRSSSVMDRFVRVNEIFLIGTGSLTPVDSVTVVFDTGLESGEGQDAGLVRFLVGGAETSENKLRVDLISDASDAKYSVTVDKILGSMLVNPS